MGKINSKKQQDLSLFPLLVTELNWMWRSYQNKLGDFFVDFTLSSSYLLKGTLGEEKNKKSLQN